MFHSHKGDLKYHVKKKHPQRPDLPAKISKSRSQVKDKPFRCNVGTCKSGYSRERDLKRHLKLKHGQTATKRILPRATADTTALPVQLPSYAAPAAFFPDAKETPVAYAAVPQMYAAASAQYPFEMAPVFAPGGYGYGFCSSQAVDVKPDPVLQQQRQQQQSAFQQQQQAMAMTMMQPWTQQMAYGYPNFSPYQFDPRFSGQVVPVAGAWPYPSTNVTMTSSTTTSSSPSSASSPSPSATTSSPRATSPPATYPSSSFSPSLHVASNPAEQRA